MKLQTKYPHKKLTTITVNGHVYDIDSNCCIDVDDEADARKLLSLNDEWTDRVVSTARSVISKQPIPGRPMRTAVEFVGLLAQDEDLAHKVAALRSFASLSSLAFNLGFKFTENEFRDATSALQKDTERAREIDAKSKAKDAAAKAPKAKEAAKEKPKPAKAAAPTAEAPPVSSVDHKTSETMPEVLPEEESGEWPDPQASFSVPYLKRMADAYCVEFPAGTSKDAMTALITKAMYDE